MSGEQTRLHFQPKLFGVNRWIAVDPNNLGPAVIVVSVMFCLSSDFHLRS